MRCHLAVLALFAGFAFQFGSSAAQADCGAKNEFEDVYCYAKQYIASDDALNASYKELVAKLNDKEKAALKKGQLAWIKKRNAECGSTDSEGYSVDLSCAVDFTEQRTQFLKEKSEACDAGKCTVEMLGGE